VTSPPPLLTGFATLNTKVDLRLHEGQNIFDRLALSGRFGITSAKFTSSDTQNKINNLSQRALGQPGISTDGDAVSDLSGTFKLQNGMMNFSRLQFAVAGAAVRLNGSYDLQAESVDFHGTLRTDAKLSQMTTGAKSILLKFVDPFFAKDGAGALVPIRIQGSRESPLFGIELHRSNPKTSN
jgi:AsmA-like protein